MATTTKPANALAEYTGSSGDPYFILPAAAGPYCTCMGWKMSKSDPKSCKHLRDYLAKTGAGVTVAPKIVQSEPVSLADPRVPTARPKAKEAPAAMNAMDLDKAGKAPWGNPDWVMDVKLDGERKLAVFGADGTPTFYSRSGLSYRYEWATKGLRLPEGTILDGELVQAGGIAKWGGGGRTETEYHVFDVLQVAEINMRDAAWDQRRETVELLVKTLAHPMVKALRVIGTPDKAQAEALMEEGFEGVMLKRRSAHYQGGKRSWDWLKYKWTSTWDVVITDMEGAPGVGGTKNLRFGFYKQGVLVVSGSLGYTGTPEQLAGFIGKVAEVKGYAFNEDTGSIRHPQFLRWRDDKLPEECTL